MFETQRVAETLKDAFSSQTADSFTNVATVLSRLKSGVREELQRVTAPEMERIIKKIKKQESLAADEIRVLRLWIVGDAEGYLAMENNYQDWLREFGRLQGLIAASMQEENSPDELLKLHGLLEDAIRVAADISNFLEKKERVEKFELATKGANGADLSFLINLLSSKLQCEDL